MSGEAHWCVFRLPLLSWLITVHFRFRSTISLYVTSQDLRSTHYLTSKATSLVFSSNVTRGGIHARRRPVAGGIPTEHRDQDTASLALLLGTRSSVDNAVFRSRIIELQSKRLGLEEPNRRPSTIQLTIAAPSRSLSPVWTLIHFCSKSTVAQSSIAINGHPSSDDPANYIAFSTTLFPRHVASVSRLDWFIIFKAESAVPQKNLTYRSALGVDASFAFVLVFRFNISSISADAVRGIHNEVILGSAFRDHVQGNGAPDLDLAMRRGRASPT
ncbi:hypothetical protein NMY22_g7770 [Coprinellus aureogranulatus]|nr:hypothetical protein NMY22_g7770 [Coprinellus aureogranulatus]